MGAKNVTASEPQRASVRRGGRFCRKDITPCVRNIYCPDGGLLKRGAAASAVSLSLQARIRGGGGTEKKLRKVAYYLQAITMAITSRTRIIAAGQVEER